MNRKVSIIIPLYNKCKYIKHTIDSILDQDYRDFEIIIVDDGSTDKSVDIVKMIADDRIRIIQKQNGGVSDARNRGIQAATGFFIYFLDADDIIRLNTLNCLYSLSIQYPKADVFCGNHQIINTKRNINEAYCHNSIEGYVDNPFEAMWRQSFFPRTGVVLFKREALSEYFFNTQISMFEDLDFFCRTFKRLKYANTSEIVLDYIKDSSELSNKLQPIEKTYAYYINLNTIRNYEKLLLAENIVLTIIVRLIKRDFNSVLILIKNNSRNFFYMIYAFFRCFFHFINWR